MQVNVAAMPADLSTAALATPPTSPGFKHPSAVGTANRPTTAGMRQHNRSSSRMAESSRSSDDDSARTAVKVAVRVRPPLGPNDPGYDLIPQRFRENTCDVNSPTNLSIQSPQGKKLFVFDRVFDEDTTQEGIWDYLSDSVSSFVKGYNVSILAYGQSGAGKSYTMGTSGPQDQDDTDVKGIVPRAAQALFQKLSGSSGQARQSALQTPKRYSMGSLSNITKQANAVQRNWELRATYVEIYNEQLRDLLLPESTPQAERSQVAIREDTKGRIMLTGLTQVPINSAEDVLNALNFGSSIRQTDATAINARSSRSHAVFSLNLIQKKSEVSKENRSSLPSSDNTQGTESVITIDSKLHFVDLAGSERLKNTGATGDRAREGISINAGLASLGKVISQLSSKHANAHISYRDSRLTRLLQDSLGGNAITFMVACVTPAAFHLSETLNTVHYAQRARAIQSKPEIQQSHEDGDKQAAIDRLRAEVSFLRDQIRHTSDQPGGRSAEKSERSDRIRGRDTELQSQIMDMQENYNALSQRHAKLIAEISKARDDRPTDTPLLDQAIGENASERIKRSNSFAEAVEQVVLEYEKTIQTLEGSLTKTRSNLSTMESSMLEKETRIAYMDTIQQQLQARIQKYMDREQNNESYTRDLERKMEGASSEDERKDTLITELRKELERARESESSAEDYISTLEERLAEAEQDQEIMQREIDRLEHVVERQRSIGRLDNLLGELDGVRSFEHTNGAQPQPVQTANVLATPEPAAAQTNGHRLSYDPYRADSDPDIPEGSSVYDDDDYQTPAGEDMSFKAMPLPTTTAEPHSPAQNSFMADKLENLTQEFFDLRGEHESVLVDFDNLQQKYRTALETLAKMEYEKGVPKSPDSANGSRPESFLAGAGVNGEEKLPAGQPSSSRSLSELPSPEQSTSGAEAEQDSDFEVVAKPDLIKAPIPEDREGMVVELESLRKLHAESEDSVAALTKNYMNLAQRHESTLSQLEDLKQEVQRAQQFRPSSPSPVSPNNLSKSLWRRKSNDVLGETSDRSSRSIVSLKTIALDHFEQNPDVRQSFDLNLTALMTELQNRSERIQALESELVSLRKEMEQKQTIISGLTRERSSLAAASTAVDFSVVGQLQEQLAESENQIRSLHEQHAEKERAFEDQLEDLKATVAEHQKMNATLVNQMNTLPTPNEDKASSGVFPITAINGVVSSNGSEEISRLQQEVAAWEAKHAEAVGKMNTSQTDLLTTIGELQESLRVAQGRSRGTSPMPSREIADEGDIVGSLQRQVDEHKSIADSHVAKVTELQSAYDDIQRQFDEDSKSRALTEKELRTQKDLVANLETQLQVHKSAITLHQESLETIQASHTQELDDIRASMSSSDREAAEKTASLKAELNAAQTEVANLLRSASSALGYETDASKLHSQIKGLVEEGKEVHTRHLKTTNDLKSMQEELRNALANTVALETELESIKSVHETSATKLEKMTDKYNKSSRLVDELEEQLNSNFDSHQATNNRLSTMQMESVHARMELEKELEEQKLRNGLLEQQIATLQRGSVASNTSAAQNRDSLSPEAAAIALARSASGSSNQRKSNATTSLPTPPPSIPLPPLPSSPIAASPLANGIDAKAMGTPRTTSPVQQSSHSPPGSRHTSHDHNGTNVTQIVEEQDARIRTIEKHLFAEKQLTATLEEALVDLENSANRTKSEMENWRKKCTALEDELVSLRREHSNSRASLQAVEEEREMRVRAERARQALEQRMAELNSKKKKKNALNCF